MSRIRFFIALYVAKFLAFGISIIDKNRGTNLPGLFALKIDPSFCRHMRGIHSKKTIFITGTNGKSTTTNLLAAIFREANIPTAVNLEGANLLPGVAATLLKNCSMAGRLKQEYIIMETDERFLPIISREIKPGHMLITNIQKDQVQRNGEPHIIYRKIKQSLSPDTCLYLNNEDPYAASLSVFVEKSLFYGVNRNDKSFQKTGFFTTTMPCPVCGAGILFDYYNIDNIGKFSCSSCGFKSQEQPNYLLEQVDFSSHSFSLRGEKYELRYEAPYFLYCYAGAIALALELGISSDAICQSCQDFVNIGGRLEDIYAGGKTVHYIRMKQENPETLQSAIDYIAADKTRKIFMLGLDELVDFHPHYTNTFYAFDCDFEELVSSDVERYICFSGTVSYDAALRLVYAGADKSKISVIESNDDEAIINELSKYSADNVYLITWLKKFMDLQKYAAKQATEKGRRV